MLETCSSQSDNNGAKIDCISREVWREWNIFFFTELLGIHQTHYKQSLYIYIYSGANDHSYL